MVSESPVVTITKDTSGTITNVVVEKKESTYDPLISLKKMLIQFAIVALVAGFTWLVDIGFPQLSIELPEYAGLITIISGLITLLLNYLKHKSDTEVVKTEYKSGEIPDII